MTRFADLALSPKVLQAVEEAGYEVPTPIQAQAIPHALEGRDVLGIAQTGTGKTASFTLPMITLLARGRARARMPRSLVLCPTRELAAQVAENFETYSKHVKLTKALLIGGVSFKEQDALIDKGVDVLIATPGRLLDHFERGKLLLTGVQIMVVDEADRMLDMGFIPDIERIFGLVPFTRQTMFYSATMAPEIERITNAFLSSPARIEVARQATASETIAQQLVPFLPSRKDRGPTEKRALLRALVNREGDACTNAIVFCNRKTEVDVVARSLKTYGYNAEPIHGDLDQSQRTRTLDGFRAGAIRLLVASDVAARGLDIPAVSHVFNYDVPSHAEDYIHRIGRTGRAGRSGTAITLCGPSDQKNLDAIEKLIGREIPRVAPPEAGAPAPDAGPMPDAGDDAAERGTRSRSRGSRRRDAPRATPAAAPAAALAAGPAAELAAESAVVPVPARAEAERPAARPEPAREAPSEPRQQRLGDGAPDRGRARRGDRRPPRDEAVIGMGDHLPSFIEKSFEERLSG